MALKNKKPHIVSVNMEEYLQILVGLRKTGKTTLFRDLILKKYGKPEAGLLLAFEKGYTALNDIMAEDIEDWEYFQAIVDELVYDKDQMPYKIIAFDTIDEMVNMAENYAIKFFNRRLESGQKRASTLNEAGGGFNRGKNLVLRIMRDSISKLSKAGYGIFLIGHSKEKKKKNADGTEYIQLSCNLTDDYNDIFLNAAHLITFLTTEIDVENNAVAGEQVYMNFRGTRFDCGSRLRNVPNRIEYGVDNYINVFEDAVKALASEANCSYEELKEQQQKEKDKESEQNIEKMKESDISQLAISIKEAIKLGLQNSKIDVKTVTKLLESHGVKTPDDIKDIEIGKKILNELNK